MPVPWPHRVALRPAPPRSSRRPSASPRCWAGRRRASRTRRGASAPRRAWTGCGPSSSLGSLRLRGSSVAGAPTHPPWRSPVRSNGCFIRSPAVEIMMGVDNPCHVEAFPPREPAGNVSLLRDAPPQAHGEVTTAGSEADRVCIRCPSIQIIICMGCLVSLPRYPALQFHSIRTDFGITLYTQSICIFVTRQAPAYLLACRLLVSDSV
jgi:hypothetical protein